jgi:hypothetical protein
MIRGKRDEQIAQRPQEMRGRMRTERDSRRPEIRTERGSRDQQWQGFPQQQRRTITDVPQYDSGRVARGERGNRSDRARWNRDSNGTPPWANRNYETPAWAKQRAAERRADRNYDYGWDTSRTVWGTPVYETYSDDRYYSRSNDRYDDWDDNGDRWYQYQTTYVYNQPTYVVNPYPFYGPVYTNNYDPYYGSSYYSRNPYYSPISYSSYDPYYSSSYPYYAPVSGYYNDPYYGDPYYRGGYYDYYEDDNYDRGSWKTQLLRFVLASVFGGGSDYGYEDRYFAGSRGGYYPDYYEESYLPYRRPSAYYVISQPWYGTYDDPYYPPYNQVNYNNYGYNDRQYDYYGSPYINSRYDPVLMSVTGNGYVDDLVKQAVAAGYYQGLQDGIYARENGYDESYYNDPYAYDGRYYDAYSTSLAERRRCMSEGYELGYRDAMAERDAEYGYQQAYYGDDSYYEDDPYYRDGNGGDGLGIYGDLISLALGSVLRVGV